VLPIIELHNFVFRAARKRLVELMANNGLNAGVVLPGGRRQSSAKLLTAVRVDGDVLGEGGLWPLAGAARGSLDWLRDHLAAAKKLSLLPDHIVIAGATLGLYCVKGGDHVAVTIDSLPITECHII
jgi:2-keto-4-pentenoate hydratase